jgi:hypothetical protein
MKITLLRTALLCGVLLGAGLSCAPRQEVAVKPPAAGPAPVVAPTVQQLYRYQPASSAHLSPEARLAEIASQAAGNIFYNLKEKEGRHLTGRVAVVVAVPLSDFKRESEFGRLLAEYLLTDLADRGLQVVELRLGKEIHILPQTGEFILSRNTGELAQQQPALDYVVVSTFSNTPRNLIIQGRLLNLRDGLVETAWRHTMPLSRELLALFNEFEQPHSIAVTGVQQ